MFGVTEMRGGGRNRIGEPLENKQDSKDHWKVEEQE